MNISKHNLIQIQDLQKEIEENDDLEKIKLEEYETENIEILKITISKSIINNTTIINSNFEKCMFIDIQFNNCNFSTTIFENCSFIRCEFNNCKLTGCSFYENTLLDTNFINVNMNYTNITISDLKNVYFKETGLKNANLQNNKVKNIKFQEADLTQIQIFQTSLNGIDLSHKDCKIRYIITINALKEGWDCPYAYILASIANKNSTADVEQLIGRVLRQPNARKYTNQELNVSYVLTCSNDFERTAKSVIAGLNGAGFSKDDYRQKDFRELEEMAEKPQELKDILEYANNENDSDEDKNSEFLSADVNAQNIAKNIELGNKTNDILKNAKTQANEYDKEVEKTSSNLDYFGDLEVKASKIKFEVEKIPQFVKLLPSGSILFEELNSKVLEKEDLEKDFKLADKDIQINFDLAEGSIFEVDLSKDDNLPKYKKVTQMQREYFKQYLKTANDETRIRQSINLIFDKLRKDNALNENDLKNYIERIVNNLSDERKAKLLDEIDAYTIKIKNKIKELKSEYREKVFYDLLNKGNIKIENTFSFQPIIQASKLSSLRDKSLYEEEIDNLNSLENRLLTEIVSLDNIKWWHRNKDMKPGFCINAFINHYPDFIICTENENIIMVEVKGDDRTNDYSKTKLKLGSKWADKAGDKYFYFMVFENSKIEGSLLIDEFIDTIKEL